MGKGPSTILGRFNSTRNPENVYTVKRHHDVDPESDKHLSCSCPGWKFSPRKNGGRYTCRHVAYVQQKLEEGNGGRHDLAMENHKEATSEINRAVVRAHRRDDWTSPKAILARSLVEAEVRIGDHAFRKLAKALRPYLLSHQITVTSLNALRPSGMPSPAIEEEESEEVLRVITLD